MAFSSLLGRAHVAQTGIELSLQPVFELLVPVSSDGVLGFRDMLPCPAGSLSGMRGSTSQMSQGLRVCPCGEDLLQLRLLHWTAHDCLELQLWAI